MWRVHACADTGVCLGTGGGGPIPAGPLFSLVVRRLCRLLSWTLDASCRPVCIRNDKQASTITQWRTHGACPGRLKHSLEALEADMKALGSSIVYRNAPESRTALMQLVQETGAQVLPCPRLGPALTSAVLCTPCCTPARGGFEHVPKPAGPVGLLLLAVAVQRPASWLALQALFFNHLYDPISLVRDNEVKAAMVELGVACYTFNSDVLYEPWEVLSPAGQPLVNFADFWKQ